MQLPLRPGTPVGAQDIFYSAEQGQRLFTIEHGICERKNFATEDILERQSDDQAVTWKPTILVKGSVRMVMIVNDPDAAFERAVTAGATVVWPVRNDYGWRLGRIVDPFGHHWEIGKPLADGG